MRIVDCACVLHGISYDQVYVSKLLGMLRRHISHQVRLHVFTESDRDIDLDIIRHDLEPWQVRRGWWYKMQMFDPAHGIGPMLYLDLDVVIIGSLDWIFELDPATFWIVRDFKSLWKPLSQGCNSSVMYWDPGQWSKIWEKFCNDGIEKVTQKYKGDQDYLDSVLSPPTMQFFPRENIKSWRWEIWDGGMDPESHAYLLPGHGPKINPDTEIIVFHGHPKPHEIQHEWIKQNWN